MSLIWPLAGDCAGAGRGPAGRGVARRVPAASAPVTQPLWRRRVGAADDDKKNTDENRIRSDIGHENVKRRDEQDDSRIACAICCRGGRRIMTFHMDSELIFLHRFIHSINTTNTTLWANRETRNSQRRRTRRFLPERDYVTVKYLLSQRKSVCRLSVVCLSSITFARPTHRVETFGNISSSLCTVAILWPPCKILRRSSQGNASVWDVKRKRVAK